MPVVPFTDKPAAQRERMAAVGNTYVMMAAAELHKAGMLFEDRANPVKDALADGTMDAVGINSTDFNKSDNKRKMISQTVVGNQ